MSIHTDLIDNIRIETARANHAALQKDEAEANAAVEQAVANSKAAGDAAQRAADKGANVADLMALKSAVEVSARRLVVAKRIAAGATTRREEGERTRDHEVRQAHGEAMNAATKRFIDIRSEAVELIAKLDALKTEHIAVRADIHAMANASKAGIPNFVESRGTLIDGLGQVMDQAEWANRLTQPEWQEWDSDAGKLRWVEA